MYVSTNSNSRSPTSRSPTHARGGSPPTPVRPLPGSPGTYTSNKGCSSLDGEHIHHAGTVSVSTVRNEA
ncbi:hypothetical protein C2E23DRAFT_185217 [Lenzites betulinus]|nr:hypothetical protein C2E23DRAFT_185217 [Lenzites betulinus]